MEQRKHLQGSCKKHGSTKFVVTSDGYSRCQKCGAEQVKTFRQRLKSKLVKLFGGKCQACGYNRHNRALQFHHVDPSQKKFAVAGNGCPQSFRSSLEEAIKCVLVCANCHAEIEDGVRECPELLLAHADVDELSRKPQPRHSKEFRSDSL